MAAYGIHYILLKHKGLDIWGHIRLWVSAPFSRPLGDGQAIIAARSAADRHEWRRAEG